MVDIVIKNLGIKEYAKLVEIKKLVGARSWKEFLNITLNTVKGYGESWDRIRERLKEQKWSKKDSVKEIKV
jgi:hypothetical protein